jgi:hypothetical protein
VLSGAFLFLSFWLSANGIQSAAEPSQPRWVSPAKSPFLADEGKCLLRWEISESENSSFTFQVEQAGESNFSNPRVRYEGPDSATYISGLPEGMHHYRVRLVSDDETGPWSESMEIKVEFVSRQLVIILLLLGSIVFLVTVWAIWKGHCQYAGPPASNSDTGGSQ